VAKIKLENGTFFYEIKGQGDTIVFISGLAADHTAWNAQIPSHSRYFRCLTFDNREVGESINALSELEQSSYSLKLLSDDIAHLMDALGIDKAHIVGASMGGVIAQCFAIDHPDRILSLSLHSTMARISSLTKLKFEIQLYLLEKLEVQDVQLSIAGMIWSEKTLSERFQIIEAFRSARVKAGPQVNKEVYKLQTKALLSTDFLSKLNKIQVPVLVTAGANDGLIPASESRLVHKAIPGSEFHIFKGCGHAASIENSRGFNTISLRFLKKHGGQRR